MINNSDEKDFEHRIHEIYNQIANLMDFEGITDDQMPILYTHGYNLFMHGKFEEAKDIFICLTANAPYTASYWRTLGVVYQRLRNYGEAISSYDFSLANDYTDVIGYAYRAESKILHGKLKEGLEDLKKVIALGEQNPEFTQWVRRSKVLLKIHDIPE